MKRPNEMTIVEAAEALGTDSIYVRVLTRKGKLRGRKEKDGRRQWFLTRKSVESYAAQINGRRLAAGAKAGLMAPSRASSRQDEAPESNIPASSVSEAEPHTEDSA